MASIAQALMLAPPAVGKVFNSAVSTCAYIDLYSALGTGASTIGGYVDIILTASGYYAVSNATTATLTQTGASAGMYLPGDQVRTHEMPLQYLYVSAGTGTIQVYLSKSSAQNIAQYEAYVLKNRP